MDLRHLHLHRLRLIASVGLLLGAPALLHAAPDNPPSATAPPAAEARATTTGSTPGSTVVSVASSTSNGEQILAESVSEAPVQRPWLVPRNRPQHTFFVDAGYLALLFALHFQDLDSGSLNEGLSLTAGYNWTSRRGLGVGVIYSGGFFSARSNGLRSTARLHYVAPEFVARQRAGRRWLFREAVGVGYGHYVRSYDGNRAGRGGVGLHERASVEFMATRWLGLSLGFGGEWILTGAPDVGDGVEFNLLGLLTFHAGGGVRLYF